MQCNCKTALTAFVLAAFAVSLAVAAEPLKVGVTFLTAGLDPTKGSNGWALVSEGIGENLYTVDKGGMLQPELASTVRRLDDFTWLVTLKADRKFSDGAPVDAKAVADALNHTFATNKAALSSGGLLTFAPRDALTFEVRTEKPVPAIATLFAEWPLIVYHLKNDGTAVFSGPYQVEAFNAGATLSLKPNPYFPGASTRSPVTVQKFGDAQAMALSFKSGDLDLAFGLPAEAIGSLKADAELTVKSFPIGYQYMALINTRRPPAADIAVRQAIDLAIDRQQLVVAIDGGQPANGAFAPYFSFAQKAPRPTDVPGARKLLDQAGWIVGNAGMRFRAGEPLRIRMLTYPQRPDLVTMLPVVKAQLQAIGIAVETGVVNDASGVAASGEFDLLLWAQHTAPSGDPAFFFNSMLRSGGSLNYTGYANPEFDTIIGKFATEADPVKRAQISGDAEAVVFKDAPISFLVSPVWHVGMSKRLPRYQPWGSDYHVLRADIGETD